jgi:hypothetical protein
VDAAWTHRRRTAEDLVQITQSASQHRRDAMKKRLTRPTYFEGARKTNKKKTLDNSLSILNRLNTCT